MERIKQIITALRIELDGITSVASRPDAQRETDEADNPVGAQPMTVVQAADLLAKACQNAQKKASVVLKDIELLSHPR